MLSTQLADSDLPAGSIVRTSLDALVSLTLSNLSQTSTQNVAISKLGRCGGLYIDISNDVFGIENESESITPSSPSQKSSRSNSTVDPMIIGPPNSPDARRQALKYMLSSSEPVAAKPSQPGPSQLGGLLFLAFLPRCQSLVLNFEPDVSMSEDLLSFFSHLPATLNLLHIINGAPLLRFWTENPDQAPSLPWLRALLIEQSRHHRQQLVDQLNRCVGVGSDSDRFGFDFKWLQWCSDSPLDALILIQNGIEQLPIDESVQNFLLRAGLSITIPQAAPLALTHFSSLQSLSLSHQLLTSDAISALHLQVGQLLHLDLCSLLPQLITCISSQFFVSQLTICSQRFRLPFLKWFP